MQPGQGSACPNSLHPWVPPPVVSFPSTRSHSPLALAVWTPPHPSTHAQQGEPRDPSLSKWPGAAMGTAAPKPLRQRAPLTEHPLPPSLSPERRWVCPRSASVGPASSRCSSSLEGRRMEGHHTESLGGGRVRLLASPQPGPCGSHPGCCACREGRSAAGGARDPRSPGGTRGSRAAPAATAGREVDGRREPDGVGVRGWQRLGHNPATIPLPGEGDNPLPRGFLAGMPRPQSGQQRDGSSTGGPKR